MVSIGGSHRNATDRAERPIPQLVEAPGPPAYSSTRKRMGRTLHYKVQADQPIPWEAWREIRAVQAVMNIRFTWRWEELALSPIESDERAKYGFGSLHPTVQAWGFTKVCEDEWNAVLVTRFIRWVSRRLPRSLVNLVDEGKYVLLGDVTFTAGESCMRLDSIPKRRSFLKQRELTQDLARFDNAIVQAGRGVYFAKVPARDYADRDEIKKLALPQDQLDRMTLDEVADRIPFPWDVLELTVR